MSIARVFPRRTKATPDDEYAFVGEPGLFLPPSINEVHVSVTFSWDLPEAERLARAWKRIAPVKIGGPATGMSGRLFCSGNVSETWLRDYIARLSKSMLVLLCLEARRKHQRSSNNAQDGTF